jgi:hypothetical protein
MFKYAMAYFLLFFNYRFRLAFKQYGAIWLKHYDSPGIRPMKNNIYENSTLAYVEFLGP